MKFKLFFLFLVCKTTFIFSQNEYQKSVDSLRFLINKEQNTGKRIELLWSLFEVYSDYEPTKTKKISTEVFQIAKKKKSTKAFGLFNLMEGEIAKKNNKLEKACIFLFKAQHLFKNGKDWDNYFYTCSCI